MKRITITSVLLLSVLMIPVLSFAHPGHGLTDGHSIQHYLTEPVHAAAIFSGIAIIAGLMYYGFSRRRLQKAKK